MVDEHHPTIGITGAGPKGGEIAVFALLGGYRVILEDFAPARLEEAAGRIAAALDAALARGEFDISLRQKIAANFAATHSVAEVSRAADFLIDASPEDAELHLEIFTIFDKFAKPQAILASAAKSVSVADLAAMTSCPGRCIGLRFPDPSSRDRSLRVIRTTKTSDKTVRACADFAHRVDLEPRIVTEPPNPVAAAREALAP